MNIGEYPLQKAKGHTRSGSTIDDLASAAIATSPSFLNGSPHTHMFNGSPITYNVSRPATSYNGYGHGEWEGRAPKRIKSDFYEIHSAKLHAEEWSPRQERPKSSYQQTTMEEAELLLGLRNSHNFNPPFSPLVPTFYNNEPEMGSAISPQVAIFDQIPQREEGMDPQTLDTDETNSQTDETIIMPDEPVKDEGSGSKVDGVSPTPRKTFLHEEPMPVVHVMESIVEVSDVAKPDILQEAISSQRDRNDSANVPKEQQVDRAPPAKKMRRVKPEVQAEVCAACHKLQREKGDEDPTMSWISCNACNCWFHFACVDIRDEQAARSIDKFVCKDCETEYGKTTYVRKSTRARTAIDYAGLNQGVVKTSADSSMHHYVQPIKDGTFKFLPDDFARLRPEFVTAENFEKAEGIPRPFVVPACWNPRFGGQEETTDEGKQSLCEDEPHHEIGPYDSNGEVVDLRGKQGHQTTNDVVLDCDQDLLDMVMPRTLTVRKVAEIYGPLEPVPVIDVKSQSTKGNFTLSEWADYYENSESKPVRNVISLEVSHSRLGRLLRRPKVVRDLDLEDHVWEADSRRQTSKRSVQFYCLMSVADSYTDFHIDFGGSSVYYHILKGTKTFFFIPPEDKYLRKYEEWCNSDRQSEEFLGDLCGGNCTRVDLHEGDTAFIPAGWIHAVWTPEDSLVIGGNFLTHLDYELQIKVAHVEKTTQVAQKFRYPFFQKVMWFALIKYLEDDPVPEDVLTDFLEDPGHKHLRANPVWHEFDDLVTSAEPGDAGYNARYYSKPELRGLPALRDYLYRTARVAADLPVPDITKKQMDSVKASVPKTHGDPLKLIKEFAVWCAWKIGNVAVPEWVHSDEVGEPLKVEKREKQKKSEGFRIPPERASSRKQTQTQAENDMDAVVPTPIMASTGTAEAEGDSSRKVKSSSKGNSQKLACEPCRRRRIKCRHKDDSEPTPRTTEQYIRPRSYSSPSAEGPKAMTTMPPLPVLDNSTNGMFDDFNATSNLAQAALASLDSQASDVSQSMLGSGTPSSKKGRSKACEECRKSKVFICPLTAVVPADWVQRRCVHDENGRIDPAKAAEPSKPRGSASSKRPARVSDGDQQIKRPRFDRESSSAIQLDYQNDFDALIDPALAEMHGMDPSLHSDAGAVLVGSDAVEDLQAAQIAAESNAALDPAQQSLPSGIMHAASSIDPMLQALAPLDTSNVHVKQEASPQAYEQIPQDLSLATFATPVRPSIEKPSYSPIDSPHPDTPMDGIGPHATSRHSSRPTKQTDRFNLDDYKSPSKPTPNPARRTSSSVVSAQSLHTTVNGRRSSSNTSGTTHQIAAAMVKRRTSGEMSARPLSRGSTANESELDADERFARELQAKEHGLRHRRTSVRL